MRKLKVFLGICVGIFGIVIKVKCRQYRSEEPYYSSTYSREDYNPKSTGKQLSSTGAVYVDDEFGNYAAASGGGGYGHGGGGGGWGWGGGGGGYGGGHGKKADCNSALGLLGVLGLASYLQNVLRMSSTTMMGMNTTGRRRRSLEDEFDPEDVGDGPKVTEMVLPMLSAVGHARDGLVPHHCVHRPLCSANRILVDKLGHGHGTSIGSMVTHAAAKFLNYGKELKSPNKILEAGKIGRSKGDCQKIFHYCKTLDKLPLYAVPPSGRF